MQGPKRRQSSKFVGSRLKLSTSCVECHRRKQKCDQKQPCGHCAKRYPPPSCIYRTLRPLSSSSEQGSGLLPTLLSPNNLESGVPVDQRLSLRSEECNSGPGSASLSSSEANLEQQQQESGHASVSFESLNKFSSEIYQHRLTAVISSLSSAALCKSQTAETSLVALSAESRDNRPSSVSHGDRAGFYEPDESILFKHTPRHHTALPPPSNFSISSADTLQCLGLTPTAQTGQLLHTFLKIVSRCIMSIDGSASPNFYTDNWVPWSLKSPLLANLGILTAAIYQAEAQRMPSEKSPLALHYKVQSIGMLNELLKDRYTAVSTEVIAAVVSLLVNEWFWLHHDAVRRHLAGLKLMIELRGGLEELGMSGFLRKLVLHYDYNVACSYEIEPTFPHEVLACGEHPVEMGIPFVISSWNFCACAEQLQISKQTAAILDDMRFLFLVLTKHVENGGTQEDEQKDLKLISTAKWVQGRIVSLPVESDVHSSLASNHIYNSCRVAASIYCTAIVQRIPLSKACTPRDLNFLWMSMWQVKLSRWKQIPGIFFFVLASVLSAAEKDPRGRFIKAMFRTTTCSIGLHYFELVDAALIAVIKLQRWLRT